ncbi:hypothetical protein D9757_008778 [Collybiopsis confluens]|uniref:Uncharacterized protein n=1 Tax=Collybiopsis confluens TaxID=2823264 RepID=A0A8H5H5G7_9AGAR|nr:hypothetical protein D9757_008778 [Collybiopsis confluens]
MRMYWTERDVIRNIKQDAGTPQLASSSPPEDWERQGDTMFEQHKWAHAKLCFERAGQPEKKALAEAYHLRQKAERIGRDSKDARLKRIAQFIEAAEAFTKCSEFAGPKGALDFNRIAGDCYREGCEFLLAAERYRAACQFNDAVRCYRQAERYDEAVAIVQMERDKIDDTLAEDVIRITKVIYFSEVQSLPSTLVREKKLRKAGALFDSLDDQLQYLKEKEMDVARAAVLVSHGRICEAAELHSANNRPLEAISLFSRHAETSEISARRAAECVLDGLWRKLTFSLSPQTLASDSDFLELVGFVERLDLTLLTPSHRDEMKMFMAILNGDRPTLRDLGRAFFSESNLSAALLCLDHCFTPPFFLNHLTVYQMAESQSLFLIYLQLLRDVCGDRRLANFHKVFGVQKSLDSYVLLSDGSYLHQKLISSEEENPLDISVFIHRLRKCISARIEERILQQESICRNSGTFRPCLAYSVFQLCQTDPCLDDHVPSAALTPAFYNTRVRIHLQQIQVLHILHLVTPYSPLKLLHRRIWLTRLYDALFPSSHVLGSLAVAQFQQIAKYPEMCKVITGWIRDFILGRYYDPIPTFLSDLTRIGTLAMVFDRPYALSTSLLQRGRYRYAQTHPQLFLRGDNTDIVPELIALIEDSSSHTSYLGRPMLALHHIVAHSLHIEINVLCNLIDKFCRAYILISCSRRDINHLHNVTLPRSWLLEPISVEDERQKSFFPLIAILSNIDHLLYGHNRHFGVEGKVPIRVRTIFMSRICRAICLLVGYNVGNIALRQTILKQMRSLCDVKRPDALLPFAYRFFVEATCWDDLAKALRGSMRRSPVDEMITILHKDRYKQDRPPSRNVRSVVYDKIEDLPSLLSDLPSSEDVLPAPGTETIGDHSVRLANGMDQNENDEEIEDVAQQEIPLSVEASSTTQPAVLEATDEQHCSASIIQQVYRRHLSRKTQRIGQFTLSRDRYFKAYARIEIEAGRYRKMILGPLPHILVFFDLFNKGALNLKASMHKRLCSSLSPSEADTIDKRITRMNGILKKTTYWKSTLEPQSDFHSRRDCRELQLLIREMHEVILNELDDLPIDVPAETKAEFDIGFKGIALEPAARDDVEIERHSASVIQRAYRAHLSRRTHRPDPVALRRESHFNLYMQSDITPGRYRKMMLGPLLHILVFIELLLIGTAKARTKLRKRTLLPLKSHEIDLLDKQLIDIINLMKRVKRWKSLLKPGSEFHAHRDCLALRALVKEIEAMIQGSKLTTLCIKVSPQMMNEFKIGYKGIAQPRTPRRMVPVKSARPTLNTEDVYEF